MGGCGPRGGILSGKVVLFGEVGKGRAGLGICVVGLYCLASELFIGEMGQIAAVH